MAQFRVTRLDHRVMLLPTSMRLACGLGIAASSSVLAQPIPSPRDWFQQIAVQAEALKDVPFSPDAKAEVRVLWHRIQGNAQRLGSAAKADPPAGSYLESVQADAEALDLVAKPDTPERRKLALCRAVDRDLAAKANSAAKRTAEQMRAGDPTSAAAVGGGIQAKSTASASSAGSARAKSAAPDVARPSPRQPPKPAPSLGELEIKANTKLGAEIVAGCEVWYVPEAWRDEPKRYKRFATLSSPSTEKLPPGYYCFWATREGRKGEFTPLTIEAATMVEIPAP